MGGTRGGVAGNASVDKEGNARLALFGFPAASFPDRWSYRGSCDDGAGERYPDRGRLLLNAGEGTSRQTLQLGGTPAIPGPELERTLGPLHRVQARQHPAVLTGLDLPYIEGYKPRDNYQTLLAQEVEAYLERNPSCIERLAAARTLNPNRPPTLDVLDLDTIIEDPPAEIVAPREPATPWLSRKGQRIDFAHQDALNRQLAKLGEEFVVHLERHRLLIAGGDDLSRKVQWVAVEIGDGLGFDVLSFDDQD